MDPNTVLENARKVAARIIRASDQAGGGDTGMEVDGETLAEAFQALDEWLSKGGFPPADWDRTRMGRR